MIFKIKIEGKKLFNEDKLKGSDFLFKVKQWYPEVKYQNIFLDTLSVKIYKTFSQGEGKQFIEIYLDDEDVLKHKESFKYKNTVVFDIDTEEICNKFLKFVCKKIINEDREEFSLSIDVFLDIDKMKAYFLNRLKTKTKISHFPEMPT